MFSLWQCDTKSATWRASQLLLPTVPEVKNVRFKHRKEKTSNAHQRGCPQGFFSSSEV